MSILNVPTNYKPFPKQMQLHNAPVSYDELILILYGGMRRAGKSAGILADAVMFCTTYPGAKCCILRETLDAVKQSFLDKLPTLFPAVYQGKHVYQYREKSGSMDAPLSRSVIFPNGSYITFQRVGSYKEALEKQGFEFHYLAIDEVTKQEERTFDYMLTTVSSAVVMNYQTGKEIRIPTKVVCGCNPGGIGHRWVKRRFIDTTVVKYSDDGHNTPLLTEDHIEYTTIPDRENPGKTKEIKTTVRFIPASWKDNIHINDSYIAILSKLPKHKREMDMHGNWDVVAGKMFEYTEDSYISRIEAYKLIEKWKPDIYISIDWGYNPSYHSAGWYAVFHDNSVIRFKQMYGQKMIFEKFVKTIKDISSGWHIVGTCLPHDMYRRGDVHRDDTGRIIGEMKSDVFDHYDLNPMGIESGKGTVEARFDKIHSASKLEMPDGTKQFRLIDEYVIIDDIEEGLKAELEGAVTSEIDPSKIAKNVKDHGLDEFGLFLTMYSEDISPVGITEIKAKDTRGKWQQRIEAEEQKLIESSENNDGLYEDEITIGLEDFEDFV